MMELPAGKPGEPPQGVCTADQHHFLCHGFAYTLFFSTDERTPGVEPGSLATLLVHERDGWGGGGETGSRMSRRAGKQASSVSLARDDAQAA